MTVFRKCSGRRPLLSLESTARASEKIALGQEFDQFSPLPPNRTPLCDSGGEARRGGQFVADWRVSRSVGLQMFLRSKHDLQEWHDFALSPPHPSPLPQHKKRAGGEGRDYGNADPGRHQRLLPLQLP